MPWSQGCTFRCPYSNMLFRVIMQCKPYCTCTVAASSEGISVSFPAGSWGPNRSSAQKSSTTLRPAGQENDLSWVCHGHVWGEATKPVCVTQLVGYAKNGCVQKYWGNCCTYSHSLRFNWQQGCRLQLVKTREQGKSHTTKHQRGKKRQKRSHVAFTGTCSPHQNVQKQQINIDFTSSL